MNKEVIKAMNRKETKIDRFHKWWRANGYKVMRVILFPIWWGMKAKDKIEKYLNSKCEWNEERAKEILDYYVPRVSSWNAEEQTFYFFDNGMGWEMKLRHKQIKPKDRRWWKVNTFYYGGKVRKYLIDNYELEGFSKTVGDTTDGYTDISFKKIF